MKLGDGFSAVRKNNWLWLLPTIVSLDWLVVSLLLFGTVPPVKAGLNIKFSVPNGMPELGSVLQIQSLDVPALLTPEFLWFSLANLAIGALLNGGWLAGVFRAIWGRTTDQIDFLEYARHYFLRLFCVRLIVFSTTMVLAIRFGTLGIFGLLLLLTPMFLTFFWEIAIVREDLPLGHGFNRGVRIMQTSFIKVVRVGLPIGLSTALISAVANLAAQSPLGYMLVIPVWSFLGSGFAATICALYDLLITRPAELQA